MRAFARQMAERMKAVAAAGAVAAFWLAVWVFVAALVAQPLILPGPGAVVVALLRLVCDAGTWAILAGSGPRRFSLLRRRRLPAWWSCCSFGWGRRA